MAAGFQIVEGRVADKITAQVFTHLVGLAALELDPAEAEYLRGELNKQLKAIAELEAIPVDDALPITSHGVPYAEDIKPALRDDQIEICQQAEAILRQAPEVEERYIVVPDIPMADLS
jgi:aspartyl-tRNA(Asn)/glutamyl-tRNA(Gln) amidotransferase subunit C